MDDHPVIHDAARAAFKEHTEYELLHAETSSEARAILEGNLPNFVIVDHDLTGGYTGIDLVRWARLSLGARAPIAILYTHRSQEEVWLAAGKAGARGFVSKGLPVSCLFEALERAGAGGIYVAPEAAPDQGESCTYTFATASKDPSRAIHCHLDAGSGALRVGDEQKGLGPKSLRLLVYLLEARLHDQAWVSFDALTKHVWGTPASEDAARLTQLVSQLRSAMANGEIIGTKVGRRGASSAYRITVPVRKSTSWKK